MQCASDEFLPRAGFAENANASFCRCDAVNLGHNSFHRLAGPDDFVITESLAKLAVFCLKPLQLQGISNCEQELVGRDRLLKKIDCTQLGCAYRHFDLRLTGHHHYGSGNALSSKLFKQR